MPFAVLSLCKVQRSCPEKLGLHETLWSVLVLYHHKLSLM